MGGGNGQKSKTKRDRNNEKKMKEQKQKLHGETRGKMTADKEAIRCKICLTTFMVTASPVALTDHFESKHVSKGYTIAQCFPHLESS
ncbi:unnamed protein product [Albugo candida]|uniref:At2g23090-like zinc-binding domain-containing protein n=1 Tax=Albugo candida TaxID=65357 RepID=A0A024GNV7_9STRA|nr:unnamed protein product [Albugo candida]|eukprot:CCI48451.1 unnamed protein product [Albugo candida]